MVFKMFIFQSTFSTIDFKQENNEYKASALKSKGLYTSKLFPLHNLSPIIKHFDRKTGLQFNNLDVVVVKNYKCLHYL